MTSFVNTLESRHREWGLRVVPSLLDHESRETHADCDSWAKDFAVTFESVLKTALEECPLIASDPDVIFGTPRIAETRIPVYMVLDAIRFYGTVQGAMTSYPQLTVDQVNEALVFATLVLEQPVAD